MFGNSLPSGEIIPLLLLGLASFIVIGFVLYFQYLNAKQRRKALVKLAEEKNYKYSQYAPSGFLDSFKDFHLLSLGRSSGAGNILEGTFQGVEFSIFDYTYTLQSGKVSKNVKLSVYAFHSNELRLPNFSLRLEGFFDKIASVFGYQDIDFDRFPKFSKTYILQGADEMEVKALFTPDLLHHYESLNGSGFQAEGQGTQILFYKANKRTAVNNIPAEIEEAYQDYNRYL